MMKLFKNINSEVLGGVLLLVATCIAMVIANTGLSTDYLKLLQVPFSISIGQDGLSKPILLWINDGLMALFFLLIGLELKKEVLEGQLRSWNHILLPAAGAVGGLVIPSGLYAILNWGSDVAMQGWAIPAATDIAFAVGLLAMLGKRVPASLKVFLVSLAIFDDLAAIIIIAVFYTSDLSILSMIWAACCVVVLTGFNLMRISNTSLYCFVGIVLWFFLLKSGVHATLAGVMLAATIPLKVGNKEPLHDLEYGLKPWGTFFIVPVFALANAGIPLSGMSWSTLMEPIPLGILLGLFVGKQVGAFFSSWLVIRFGFASLPYRATWAQLYGVCVLTGIGFTMSLFISGLAFEHSGQNPVMIERMGILSGSLLSAVFGMIILLCTHKEKKDP